MLIRCSSVLALFIALLPTAQSCGQTTLEAELKQLGSDEIAQLAAQHGDARRGAIVFYQPYLACSKCHVASRGQKPIHSGFLRQVASKPIHSGSLRQVASKPIGPDLSTVDPKNSNQHLVESILDPSKVIRKGFETIVAVKDNGVSVTGLLSQQDDKQLVLKDATGNGKLITLQKATLDDIVQSKQSIMPAGQVNVLTSRQQFLDLVKYLMEIRDGGSAKADELQPAPSLYAARPLPEYEQHVDHAGILSSLNSESFKRGEAIYNRLCINCHGDHQRPGSLPTALRFAEGKFRSGSDPHTMYRTLTHGFGMMVPQTWMVPQQKYDVIHYIREDYLKDNNPSQYAAVDAAYLSRLPKGNTRGPAPVKYEPWVNMNYGPSLINTYEFGKDGSNFAYKGIAARLDAGPGGMSRGRYWMAIDHDTLRMAGAWSGDGFLDWNGIHFNGRHNIHPRAKGTIHVQNPSGPGWANPDTGSFEEVRVIGRDGRRYGPLPRKWAHYKGLYHDTNRTVISYTVGDTPILEMPGVISSGAEPVFTRALNIGPRPRDLIMQVAKHAGGKAEFLEAAVGERKGVLYAISSGRDTGGSNPAAAFEFSDGAHLVGDGNAFNMQDRSFTIAARIRPQSDGTIFAKAPAKGDWQQNSKAFFLRGGRLTFDIGWVGAVRSRGKVRNGRWTNVTMTWNKKTNEVTFYINGKSAGGGKLKPKERKNRNEVVKIGFAADNFPNPSAFNGEMESVQFIQQALSDEEIRELHKNPAAKFDGRIAMWNPSRLEKHKSQKGKMVARDSVGKHDLTASAHSASQSKRLLVAVNSPIARTDFQHADDNLRLRIPAGDEPIRMTLAMATLQESSADTQDGEEVSSRAALFSQMVESVVGTRTPDLTAFTKGGPPRWPERLTTKKEIGKNDGPYAVDVLTRPADNPWLAQVRLTGFDFYPDGDSAAVCAWDGDVYHVTGLSARSDRLTWQRIASGLFQPLGLKIVNGKIHVTCRDQLCVLHDLNGDGETDYYENLNNDHQVTEHFHEFAMGLQTDDDGNFYYAKSARHALKAIVPHHGTLLKVSPDGATTEILATGFRAANGVCLNPDGTFIVTDQEGHWNPKNRINYVKEGGFYGNMFGYHDVTNSADDAMEQPLCWITNAFDRSPAELLWADSKNWGPLGGMLLNLSYGYGKIYVVPHEKIDGQAQGGMCALPIPQFPTGVMRGRFSPVDGQLYCCGMFAWAGSQHQPGGFYRVRYTGKPVHMPAKLQANRAGMRIVFTGDIDPASVSATGFKIKVWSLKRTANYGSKHYDERTLKVSAASLEADGRTVVLKIPEIKPTWCMEIKYELRGSQGENVFGTVHNTIHRLPN